MTCKFCEILYHTVLKHALLWVLSAFVVIFGYLGLITDTHPMNLFEKLYVAIGMVIYVLVSAVIILAELCQIVDYKPPWIKNSLEQVYLACRGDVPFIAVLLFLATCMWGGLLILFASYKSFKFYKECCST